MTEPRYRHRLFLAGLLWCALVGLSLAWNLYQSNAQRHEMALETVRSFFEQILITRRWNARHGGVYVPVTPETQPNPYLEVPKRDLQCTGDGDGDVSLTLINPAFMTRQLGDIARERSGVQFHITSLNLVRPENQATDWEADALRQFEQGLPEKGEIIGESFRYMAPLITEQACLECHEKQGYKLGDVRGGVSVTLPHVAPIPLVALIVSHVAIGLGGLLILVVMGNLLEVYHRQLRDQAEEAREAREAAESANAAKSLFLAHMSHEIRTPMNGILGLSELALERPLDATTREYVKQLRQSGVNLLGLLNDILDRSKIEAGQLTLEEAPFSHAQLLEDERALFRPVAAAKGLDLEIETAPDVPHWLIGDALRLRQVLSNLLNNAIKFTAQGRIGLRVDLLDKTNTHATLCWTVSDTGIGMDAHTQAGLFQPFSQGDDSIARRFGGTGLGLSISHRLVELMGGDLSVTSVPDTGSEFRFALKLPLATVPSQAESDTAAKRLDLTGVRILVAEDQPINQRVIGDMLGLLGGEVRFAGNGQEALDQLASDSFDLVLMDIQMPDMDGITATRQLRANPAWCELPVIALTAGLTADERQAISAAGMNGLLPKPLTLDALNAILARWLPQCARVDASTQSAVTPGEPDTAPALTLPGFDLSSLQQLFDDPRQIVDVLREFADSIRESAQSIADAVASQDTAAARQHAHRLRGVAGNVGAMALSKVAEELEQALDGQTDRVPELVDLLGQVHADTLKQIGALQDSLDSALDAANPAVTPGGLVLLVDNAPENLRLMATTLHQDVEVKIATTGQNALKIAHGSTLPDVIVIDLSAPELAGDALCAELKTDPITQPIPIIAVIGAQDALSEARAGELGAADVITKPIDPEALKQTVQRQVQAHRSNQTAPQSA